MAEETKKAVETKEETKAEVAEAKSYSADMI